LAAFIRWENFIRRTYGSMKVWSRKTPLLICAFVWQLAQSLHAQQPPTIRFDHLSLEQGVSHNLVFCIKQDRDGFLWFGTMYGLVKYDGRNYTVYRHDPGDELSISFNDVIAIHEDRRGYLWIGTWGGGLNKFERASGKFTRFLHDPNDSTSLSHNVVWDIEEDQNGTIWIGTESGLDKLVEKHEDAGSSKIARFTHTRFNSLISTLPGKAAVHDIYQDRAGRLWIGTFGAGLHLVHDERQIHVSFKRDSANSSSLNGSIINAICEDKEGNLWIGTAGGLNKLRADQAKLSTTALTSGQARFTHYRHDPKNPDSVSDNAIGPILEDRNGLLWIGTISGGLNKFDPATGRFIRYAHDPADSRSLSSNSIVALCEDRSGILWIGSYKRG
jgi:ligand-binding sensor domain-containing protein